ncbi:MAG: AAA family ATPase [Muribaculaceae bacterium]|nr:AAA family ATPase [Muribaculaceae bacterium]
MTSEDLYKKVLEKAKEFGIKPRNKVDKIYTGNAVVRTDLNPDKGAYFGFISEEEAESGTYSDFSFVVFPDNGNQVNNAIVGLVVGSEGFRNDYELASLPWVRRLFSQLYSEDNKEDFFSKADFTDFTSTLSTLTKKVKKDYSKLAGTVEKYKTVIQACEIVKFDSEGENKNSLDRIYRWLATYAKMREFGNEKERNEQKNFLPNPTTYTYDTEKKEIKDLLESRKYVVLQGAPGTGKTYTALSIAQNYTPFFIQFHAETTYSDFVEGLTPNTDPSSSTRFVKKPGILLQAIEYAKVHTNEKVLLIIDEINRANLANVLGPVFLLFEQKRNISINGIDSIPGNLYVIATMNTADRSLAVVDFALRRRFAWYTLHPIKLDKPIDFDGDLFEEVAEIFRKHATDAELALQPGQSYFMYKPKDNEKRKEKIKYELMPLIKEYLAEGYLLSAKTEFCGLFLKNGCQMYE